MNNIASLLDSTAGRLYKIQTEFIFKRGREKCMVGVEQVILKRSVTEAP